ncbi:MAG: M3 family oligoendopeptidase [Bacteroidota bacterium]
MQEFLTIQDNRLSRTFLPKDFDISDWETLEPYFKALLETDITSPESLQEFLKKRNELDALVSEDYAWRYIRKTRDTQNEAYKKSFLYFLQEIIPHLSTYRDQLNRKIAATPYLDQLEDEPYLTYVRGLKRQIELFREENVALSVEEESTSQQHGATLGAMTVEIGEQTLTIQEAGKILESRDRARRQEVWEKIAQRRAQDYEKLQDLFDKLISLRHQMAGNAGYSSYTRYKFDAMGRFDYSLEDTYAFHDAVEKVVKPVYESILEERRIKLGLEKLRPWDLQVDVLGDEPLVPFDREKPEQLLARSVQSLAALKPELGEMLKIMDQKGFLDLETRIGKQPGGYNYPLMETGIPFIFMNAAGTQNDVITMLHESGHAVHSFVTRFISLNALKQTPSEVAELASMTMELLCLDQYKEFYPNHDDLIRAQKGQLIRCITIFPWIAAVDAFQQWAYDHPNHTHGERNGQWKALFTRFHGDAVDWSGYEDSMLNMWVKQGHIFDVPFYYIEYAIAQLGALAIWRNYKQDPEKGMNEYLEALKLGYTKPIPQIYEAAGIKFDFSAAYMKECVDFCLEQYHLLTEPSMTA